MVLDGLYLHTAAATVHVAGRPDGEDNSKNVHYVQRPRRFHHLTLSNKTLD